MPRRKNDLERTYLLNSLSSWKSLNRIEPDPYLDGLIDALDSGTNLESWAILNPLEYLPHPELQENEKIVLLFFGVTILRNAFVFLPVAITWLAISKATSAFAAYTAENSLNVVNFLDFWENGYGVLDKNWSVSNVATLDFQIILLIIALTITIGIFDKRSELKHEARLDLIERDRVQIALEIMAYLSKIRRVTPQIFNTTTSGILRNLAAAAKSMELASRELKKSINSQSSNSELNKEVRKIKSRVFGE
jgi:hypothetical protein